MKTVSMCGVDLYQAHKLIHKSHTLQFVAGLGPRKSNALQVNLQSASLIARQDLIQLHMMGASVFTNSASFLKIPKKHMNKKKHDFHDALDDTRVHPEDYELARKMAADAMDVDEDVEDDRNASSNVGDLLARIKDDSHGKVVQSLEDLDLISFADELERKNGKPKRKCLFDIKNELTRYFLVFIDLNYF